VSQVPLVSAVIPCYNGAAYLADAVASIRRQKYPAVEIIIIDDGSTDDSAAISATLIDDDLHYFHQQNLGSPGARNAGLKYASGEVITFLDVDDVWSDNKLELQMSLLNATPETGIVIGCSQTMHLIRHEKGKQVFEPWSDPAPLLSFGCAVIRRSVFNTVGHLDQTQRYCDDWDWFMRAREQGILIKMHTDVVHYYRRHESNMTNEVEIGNQHTLMMLKKSLDRRRRMNDGQAESLPGLDLLEPGPGT
jgi:glycosyltransferase involved in cell wall biosynthesis